MHTSSAPILSPSFACFTHNCISIDASCHAKQSSYLNQNLKHRYKTRRTNLISMNCSWCLGRCNTNLRSMLAKQKKNLPQNRKKAHLQRWFLICTAGSQHYFVPFKFTVQGCQTVYCRHIPPRLISVAIWEFVQLEPLSLENCQMCREQRDGDVVHSEINLIVWLRYAHQPNSFHPYRIWCSQSVIIHIRAYCKDISNSDCWK